MICGTIAYSQSIQVKSGPLFGEVYGKITDEQLIADLTLKNTTSDTVKFKMSVELVKLVMGHEISICWNVCLPPFHDNYISPVTYQLEPNGVTNEGLFSVHLYPYMLLSDNPVTYSDPAAGTTQIKIIFENANDANDKYEYNITYTVVDPNTAVEISPISDLDILEITPNPSVGQSNIKFINSNSNAVTYLEIFDVQGNLVINKDLTGFSNNVSIDTSKLPGGSYYCQLVSDGLKKSIVKSLIVKR
jgi:hypothetical protein